MSNRKTRGASLAARIADSIGGTVHELPSEVAGSVLAIRFEGRMPLLVLDHGWLRSVALAGSQAWQERAPIMSDAMIDEIVRHTTRWARTHPADESTLYELAAFAASTLAEALATPTTVHFPGTPQPTTASIRSATGLYVSASVGRLFVWPGEAMQALPARTLGAMRAQREPLIALAREQLERHAANERMSDAITAIASRVADALTVGLARACVVRVDGRADARRAVTARVLSEGGPPSGLASIRAEGETLWLCAGPTDDGWQGPAGSFAQHLDAITAAALRSLSVLHVEQLVPGHRYRVVSDLQALKRGAIVRFAYYDDVDNHFGRYVFSPHDDPAVELAVTGDFSSPANSPLAEAHRYLERIED